MSSSIVSSNNKGLQSAGHKERDDGSCQVCKLDKYLRPDVKILVSLCFHRMYGINTHHFFLFYSEAWADFFLFFYIAFLEKDFMFLYVTYFLARLAFLSLSCESCIDRVFRHGSAPCPVCLKQIRKMDLQSQTFDDMYVEREVRTRKKVLRTMNKREEDFPSIRDYNNYLELVEDMIYNLVNEIDVENTNEKIDKYRRENQGLIAKNSHIAQQEAQAMQNYIAQEKSRKERLFGLYKEELAQEAEARKIEKESLLNELASSSKDADSIVSNFKESCRPQSSTTGSISSAKISRFPDIAPPNAIKAASIGMIESANDVNIFADPLDTLGHNTANEVFYDVAPSYHDPYYTYLVQKGFYKKSGGSYTNISYLRALESAYQGMFIPPKK